MANVISPIYEQLMVLTCR